MKFVTVAKCGLITIEDVRRAGWVKEYNRVADTRGTIILSQVGVETTECGECGHAQLLKLEKPVARSLFFAEYESKCPMIVLRDGGQVPVGWVQPVINREDENKD